MPVSRKSKKNISKKRKNVKRSKKTRKHIRKMKGGGGDYINVEVYNENTIKPIFDNKLEYFDVGGPYHLNPVKFKYINEDGQELVLNGKVSNIREMKNSYVFDIYPDDYTKLSQSDRKLLELRQDEVLYIDYEKVYVMVPKNPIQF